MGAKATEKDGAVVQDDNPYRDMADENGVDFRPGQETHDSDEYVGYKDGEQTEEMAQGRQEGEQDDLEEAQCQENHHER